MEVEVRQASNVFLKAEVQKVSEKGIKVDYLGNWSTPELASFDRCRIFLSGVWKAKSPLNVNSIVEAYVQQPKSEVYAWQKARVREIKGGFAVVECIEGPANNGVVSLRNCRAADQTTPLSYELYEKFKIKVPADLMDYFADPDALKPLLDTVENTSVKFVKEKGNIVASSFCHHAIQCVKLVSETFIAFAKQKKTLIEQLQETKSEEDADPSLFVEEFSVPDDLVGMAIGKKGSNISKAREIPGVLKIEIDKSRQEKFGVCKFKVVAKTAEAAEKARRLLEFIYADIPVSKSIVGQVVGRQGKQMQDIVNQSGAIKVSVGNGDERMENEKDEVDLVFSGSRESFHLAKLMVQLRVKHIVEMDTIRSSINAAKNRGFSSSSNTALSSNRNQPSQKLECSGSDGSEKK